MLHQTPSYKIALSHSIDAVKRGQLDGRHKRVTPAHIIRSALDALAVARFINEKDPLLRETQEYLWGITVKPSGMKTGFQLLTTLKKALGLYPL